MKNPNQHSDRALYVLVGGSLVANAAFWFLTENVDQFRDNSGGWGPQTVDYLYLLMLLVGIVFFVVTLIYLIRSIFKHLPSPELIKRTVLCLIAMAFPFGVLILSNQ